MPECALFITSRKCAHPSIVIEKLLQMVQKSIMILIQGNLYHEYAHGLTCHWRICITSYLNTECSSSLARIISFCAILNCLSLMITYNFQEMYRKTFQGCCRRNQEHFQSTGQVDYSVALLVFLRLLNLYLYQPRFVTIFHLLYY